jgi:transcriptional regulator with XRE-family HTH domain
MREIGRRSGVSANRIAQLMQEGPTTIERVERLARVLHFDAHEGLRLAGLEVPKNRHLITEPITDWTVDEMLNALRDRFAELTRESEPDVAPLTVTALRARGLAIVRLDELVAEVREAGDPAGAAQIAALSASMLREVEALEEDVTGAQVERSNGHAE